MSSCRLVSLCLALLGAVVFCLPVSAQAPNLSVAETQRLVRENDRLVKELQDLFQQAKYQQALPKCFEILQVQRRLSGDDSSKSALIHNFIGLCYYHLGDYATASKYYQKSAEIYRKASGESTAEIAQVYHSLGSLSSTTGDHGEAKRFFELALAIRRRVLGEEDEDTADTYDKYGVVLKEMGDYTMAREYQETALAIRRKLFGDADPRVVDSYLNISSLFSSLGDYASARTNAEKALAIQRKTAGENHPRTGTAYLSSASAAANLGDSRTARAYYEKALSIYRGSLGDQHPQMADLYNNYGVFLHMMGDFSGAQEAHQKALAIRLKTFGENHGDTAESYSYLAWLRDNAGDVAGARALFEKALTITRKAFGEEHERVASLYDRLGVLESRQGDYGTARVHYEKALAIRRKVFGEDHPRTANAYHGMGLSFFELGDRATARSYLERAFAISQKALGEEDLSFAVVCDSLGQVCTSMKDYGRARETLEKAYAIRVKVLGEKHIDTARCHNSLGNLDAKLKNYSSARKHYEQLLATTQEIFGNDYHATATAWANLGSTWTLLGDYAAARKHNEKALEMMRGHQGEDHNHTALVYENLTALEVLVGDWPAAANWVELERKASRKVIAQLLPRLSEREQLQFLDSDFRRRTSNAMSLALKQQADQAIVRKGAGWLLNSKGLAQQALSHRALLAREAQDPKLAPLAHDLQAVRAQLGRLSLATADPKEAAARKKQLDELTAREASLALQLAQADKARVNDDWVQLESVRKTLKADARLVEIARYERYELEDPTSEAQELRYLAFVIPAADQGDIQLIDLGEAERIDKLVEDWRTSIARAREDEGDASEGVSDQLTDLLSKPLAPALAGAKRLYLSPDGPLWLAPWAALPIGDGKLLIENVTLEYLISGRDLVAPAVATSGQAPLIFADPDYDLVPQQAQAAVKAVLRSAYREEGVTLATASRLGRASRLPGTAVEAEAISSHVTKLAGSAPIVYSERYALEAVAKAARRPRVAVFATHGFFLPDQEAKPEGQQLVANSTVRSLPLTKDGKPFENPLTRCGLLFAGCNPRNQGEPGSGDDGVLTGMEVVGIDFRGTELVVLSACQSGVGAVNTGEGVAGLRQAFQLAGSRAVVATLWQIPDRDSAVIMTDFFENLAAGQDKAEALRNAQLKRITARREKYGAAHPFFWAAWTLTGK